MIIPQAASGKKRSMTDLHCTDMTRGSNCALVLAGGAGSRVNGRDKGLLDWQGMPLVDHVLARVSPQVQHIYISCNRNRDRYRTRAALTPRDSYVDFQGPLAGIEAARHSLNTDYILIVPCDTPNLPEDLFERLLAALQDNRTMNVAYAATEDGEHYLCAVLNRRCLASLPRFLRRGERTVRRWYAEIGAQAVLFQNGAAQFININHLPD